ncbi:MAG: hypothetical protein JWO38_7834 [Gemmataceae bacterium]|nr:hypothetical protein [Gemmataceae bacterium]
MADHDFPHTLARRWRGDYAEHLFLTIALRDLVRHRVNRGPIRGLITARSVALLEVTDQLAAFGLRPTLGLAGAESDLWSQTVRYASQIPWLSPPAGVHVDELTADLIKMQDAWNQFEAFAGELPEHFYEMSAVLTAGTAIRADGLPQYIGPRFSPTIGVGERLLDRSGDCVGPSVIV